MQVDLSRLRPTLGRMDGIPPMSDGHLAPFFLVGAVRSGTTVLRLLIGHHPQICRCDEFEYVTEAVAGQTHWPDVDAYVRWLPRHRGYRASGFRANPSLGFPEIAQDFLAQLQQTDGRRIVGAAVHHHFDELPRIWPEARYIHLVRDPRDVARSCVQMGWHGNSWSAISMWEEAEDAWQRLRRRLPEDRWMEVRFENLTSDLEFELARITRFLGVDYDPAMLEIERDTTYKRPSPRGARSWRTDASEREVREMEARLGQRLVGAGYKPSGFAPLEIGRLRSSVLRLDSRLGRIKFAIRRYGLSLWCASVVCRRLPFQKLRDRVQMAIDGIDERYLK
jgi:hypothetical protein